MKIKQIERYALKLYVIHEIMQLGVLSCGCIGVNVVCRLPLP